jgi:hypothetical protein
MLAPCSPPTRLPLTGYTLRPTCPARQSFKPMNYESGPGFVAWGIPITPFDDE